MANEQAPKVVGEICSQCNKGKYVLNPKTGKIFCEDKCWLGGQQGQSTNEQKFAKGLDKDLENEKWEKIGIQKMRSILAVAYIRAGKSPLDRDVLDELEAWETYILTK